MGGQGKWKPREGRNRVKVNCCGNRNVNNPQLSTPTPSFCPSPYRSHPVLSEVGEETTRHFYAILRNLTSRLRDLELHMREPLRLETESCKCQCGHPSRKEPKPEIKVRRLHELSKGKCKCCHRPLDFIPSCSRQQEIRKNQITLGIQTESPYLSRTIDVTQCPYCSS